MSGVVDVRVLGPVEADGSPVTGRDASVLAALAVAAPHAVTTERLIDDVWGEDAPVTAAKALQNAISRLRRTLGAEAIDTVGGGYRLAPSVAVDVVEVEHLVAAGDPGAALSLWRGDPTAVPAASRVRLDELRQTLEDEVAEELVAAGDVDAAVADLERLVSLAPYRERRWTLLVRALGRAGRQADALRAVQRARRVLANDLGLDPGPELLAAEREVLSRTPAPIARRMVHRPASSFVGRSAELDAVASALARHRLVTLVGPGGVGKSRLALASTGGECALVDLAAVTRPAHVWEAVAAAAGVATSSGATVTDAVLAALDPAALLLLDSCEHVLDVAAEVAELVPCGVLATSREPLGLVDEHVLVVPPLARDDAVRLFAERAGVEVGASVAALCARLDDLPLAIELAAARASILGPEQILARLDDRFDLLDDRARRGHPRHRALRAMVEWSVDLLRDDERALFERVSVFRSTFTIEDAEAVVVDDALPRSAVAPAMTRLVRASVVTVDADRRLRLLDTFRAYAEASLTEPERWRHRHLEWVSRFAREASAGLVGPDQVVWLDRCATMLDDVQAALAWCEEDGDATVGLQVAADLFHFWMGRARRHEGLRWVRTFVEAATAVPAVERCHALYGAGMIAMMQDLESVEGLAEVALAIADDRDSIAVAEALAAVRPLWSGEIEVVEALAARCMPVLDEPQHAGTMPVLWDIRAWVAALRGDLEGARRIHGRSIAVLADLEDRHLYGAWLSLDADLAFAQGLHDETAALAASSVEIARSVSCPSCESSGLTTTALVHDHPLDPVVRSYVLIRGIGELIGTLMTLPVLAGALVAVDVRAAARVAGIDDALRGRHRIAYDMPGRAAFATAQLTAGRASLGADEWDALLSEGRRLGPDDALGLVP